MKIILLCIAVSMFLSSFSVSQDFYSHVDFNLTGAGARAEGFGGAFIGLADDATAVVWNPAGLTQLERAEASVVSRYIQKNSDFTNNIQKTLNSDNTNTHLNFNFGSFAMPLSLMKIKFVAAVSYQRQLDFNGYVANNDERTDFQGNKIIFRDVKKNAGGVNTITPAIGIKISPMIAVGFAANIWTGKNDINNKRTHSDKIANSLDYSATFSGFNFAVGGMLDFEGMKKGFPLKIGASVKSPFKLSSKGDAHHVRFDPPPAVDAKLKSNHTIDMPLMVGVGASYRIGENLTIASDFEMRNFSGKNITIQNIGITVQNAPPLPISKSGSDLNEFRLGAEYLLVFEKAVIPIRAGFKTVPTVFSDLSVSFTSTATGNEIRFDPTGEQVRGIAIALGSGFISNLFAFDLALSAQSYTQKVGKDAKVDFLIGTLSSSVIIYF